MAKRILVVAAHPDDEALGCGGTIARHTRAGDDVQIVFMADGVNSRIETSADSEIRRVDAAERAGRLLGVSDLCYLGLPDNRMDSIALLDIVQPLEGLIRATSPDVIYTHHQGDLNVDHQRTHQAVMTACRPQPGFSVSEIYSFEVLSSTEWQTPNYQQFCPSMFVDIADYVEVKRAALMAYEEEMRPEPHSRSVGNAIRLAQLRGNSVGLPFAEAFIQVRCVR